MQNEEIRVRSNHFAFSNLHYSLIIFFPATSRQIVSTNH